MLHMFSNASVHPHYDFSPSQAENIMFGVWEMSFLGRVFVLFFGLQISEILFRLGSLTHSSRNHSTFAVPEQTDKSPGHLPISLVIQRHKIHEQHIVSQGVHA